MNLETNNHRQKGLRLFSASRLFDDMSEIYKLEFEVVSPIGKGFRFYACEQPICRPEEVPDEYWTKTSRETDNPWQQYNQLKAWVKTGEQLIRNVKLFKAASQPEWTPVDSSKGRDERPGPEKA